MPQVLNENSQLRRSVARTALVLGAGIVRVSVAVHLRRRGWDVVLVDRQGPGEGASFGNGGLIQREAVYGSRGRTDQIGIGRYRVR